MTPAAVLAVDGGNSKTDLALLGPDGAVLALVRGPLGSPHHLGFEGSVDLLQAMLDDAMQQAGLSRKGAAIARVGQILLAGLDYPAEEHRLGQAIEPRGWAERLRVGNDTFAVLRAGTERRWGVAITCGAGINCVAVAPDGRRARFPSLGAITGDWGGGKDVGIAALGAAVRSQDGRGPATSLESAVAAHFGLPTPLALAEAIHTGSIPVRRLNELAPTVFSEAARDGVAAEIVDRLAIEIVAYARAAIAQLDLAPLRPEVILGGGLIGADAGRLVNATRLGLVELGLDVVVRPTASPPIVGAALLGLDELRSTSAARERARRELDAAAGGHPMDSLERSARD